MTAVGVVDMIVTEMCVIEVTKDGLLVTEIAPETTKEEVLAATQADLKFVDDLKVMNV
ncbi:hypothetical protein SDC9_209111 [bioreactor metagenome]|uniref:Butyrate--acetoacetate CoA-transferase subunit B n=1 Tax=bioreactor metagenome TaxID=1076179 RepID=A0A645JCD1_9ZZZZ